MGRTAVHNCIVCSRFFGEGHVSYAKKHPRNASYCVQCYKKSELEYRTCGNCGLTKTINNFEFRLSQYARKCIECSEVRSSGKSVRIIPGIINDLVLYWVEQFRIMIANLGSMGYPIGPEMVTAMALTFRPLLDEKVQSEFNRLLESTKRIEK